MNFYIFLTKIKFNLLLIMEDNFDAEELEIVLGLKNKKEEINKIISEQNGLSFIGAISKILTGKNSNDLYEENESEENQNEMFSNFSKQFGIDNIATVKLKDYENSNFVNKLKGEDKISHNPNLNYSNEFLQKLKKDFVIKNEEVSQPIEIKSNNYEHNNDYNNNKYKKNKKDFNKNENNENEKYKKNNKSKKNNYYNDNYNRKNKNKNNENVKIIEKKELPEDKKENENEKKDNDNDKKEGDDKNENNIDKKEDEKEDFKENEEEKYEENENYKEGNNQENKPGNTYKKNYNNRRYKYDKNKGHKAYRERVNARRYNK